LREDMTTDSDRVQRRELFERKMHS
jgi:hypothetical protein